MRIASVFKWILLLTTGCGIALAAAGIWLLNQRDDLIRVQLMQKFAAHAPQLALQFDSVELPGTSRMAITGLEILDRPTGRLLVRIDRLEAGIDESLLVERQVLLLRSLEVSGVELHVLRRSDGTWNWQDYQLRSQSEQPLIPPVVQIRDLTTHVFLEHGDQRVPGEVKIHVGQFEAIPFSRSVYQFLGSVELPGAGELALQGGCDLSDWSWSIAGAVSDVLADENLLEVAEQIIPQLSDRIGQVNRQLSELLPPGDSSADVVQSTGDGSLQLGRGGNAIRMTGRLDVRFEASRAVSADAPEIALNIGFREGVISSAVLPIRLTGIHAGLDFDNSVIRAHLHEARDGAATISGSYERSLDSLQSAATASVEVRNFPVGMQWKPFLPPRTQRFFDHFQPSGTVTGQVEAVQTEAGRWMVSGLDAQTDDASLEFHKFRYPVNRIAGRIQLREGTAGTGNPEDVVLDLTGNGMLGESVVTASGWMKNPGERVELEMEVHSDGVAIDGSFREALDEKGRRVLDAMEIRGAATADVFCRREPGLDRPTGIQLTSQLLDSEVRFRGFPWKVENITGELRFDSLKKDWEFIGLRGIHGDAEVTAGGRFRGLPSPGELQLTIRTTNASLDADLFNALNAGSRSVWSVIDPEGKVDLTTNIEWTVAPDAKAQVRLEDVRIYDAVICPKPFPYRMRINSARLSFDPNDPRFAGRQHCEIYDLRATHDGAPITAGGWAEVNSDGEWQVHLNRVNARDLRPDDQLRGALPATWRETLSRFGRVGLVSLVDSEVDFRGRVDNSVSSTAAWSLDFRLADCKVDAGLQLTDVTGRVRAMGSWNGKTLDTRGDLQDIRLKVLEMDVDRINGPWRVARNELVLGSRDVILGKDRPVDVPSEQRIQARAFGGTIGMDGRIDLSADSQYRMFGELQGADLETYARKHAADQKNLTGRVGAWIFLEGQGSSAADVVGRGQVQITEAALYEIPVVLELISALGQLNFNVPNGSAFNQALASFSIANEAFRMGPVDLAGEALSLRGQGWVGFGGDVWLDFFSRPPGLRLGRNPITDIFLQSATQWVTVRVRGTTSRPQTTVSSRPQLDESVRRLLETFNPRPGVPLPGLNIPVPPLLQR